MKREEKNALSRQRILDAAMDEFARKGYEGASLSSACTEKGLSKGVVYHHFRDKDELYLLCVQACFDALAAHLAGAQMTGASKMGLLLSMLRQGLLYVPFILLLPGWLGVMGIYLAQPAADVLTILLCLVLIAPMKRIAARNMREA